MPFPLRITFGGMCLLVRDVRRADGRKMLHALMPPVAMRHDARLIYHQRLEDPAAPADALIKLPLENKQIDLTGLIAGSSLDSDTLPGEIFHLRHLDARPISRALLDLDDTGSRVLSRVSLAAGKADGHLCRGANCHVRQKANPAGPPRVPRRRMATSVEWLIPDVPGRELKVRIRGLNGSAGSQELILNPPRGNGEIHLVVLHGMPREVENATVPLECPTGNPNLGRVDHFSAHYDLWNPPIDEDVPEILDNEGGGGPKRGTEFTCILAAAEGEPG